MFLVCKIFDTKIWSCTFLTNFKSGCLIERHFVIQFIHVLRSSSYHGPFLISARTTIFGIRPSDWSWNCATETSLLVWKEKSIFECDLKHKWQNNTKVYIYTGKYSYFFLSQLFTLWIRSSWRWATHFKPVLVDCEDEEPIGHFLL